MCIIQMYERDVQRRLGLPLVCVVHDHEAATRVAFGLAIAGTGVGAHQNGVPGPSRVPQIYSLSCHQCILPPLDVDGSHPRK
jgi:hypothetical protein